MEQGSISIFNKSIAIIGGGPAGCICAKFLQDFGYRDVCIFEYGKILRTLLPTGGGRCNISHRQQDFKELAKNYPRGEKFLYSVFSKFGTDDTVEFFRKMGIDTYTQEDNRIFPKSNSSSDVRNKILNSLKCKIIKEKIDSIKPLNSGYKLISNKCSYAFDVVIIAIGGHNSYSILKDLGINIIDPVQSLVGLITKEDFSKIAGVSVKNVTCENIQGDILFTHKGVSGPLIYTISSIKARDKMPYELSLELVKINNFQEVLNQNPHKEIKNVLNIYMPKSLCEHILKGINISPETQCHTINSITRDKIINTLENFKITIVNKAPDGEVVTCGGIDLKEITPQTLELKKYPNLYCCGEVMDIDGYCGGFNLQNCWSGAFVAANAVLHKENLH